MASNFVSRAFSSFFLLILFILLYIFNFNHLIFIVFFSLAYLELYTNKITNLFWFIISFFIYFIFLNYANFINNFILTNFIYITLIYLTFIFLSFLKSNILISKILLNLFILLSFILFTLLYIYNFNVFFIVIMLTSINDILAYLFGSFFKGPKIIPSISPNKTWSGTIISYTISVVVLFVFFNFNNFYSLILPITFFIGDIYFSNFKRILNIKDYGSLIKGHGGFLDRFDSSFLSLSFSFIFLPLL